MLLSNIIIPSSMLLLTLSLEVFIHVKVPWLLGNSQS